MKNKIIVFALICSIALGSSGGIAVAAEKQMTDITEGFEINNALNEEKSFETERISVSAKENAYTIQQSDYRKRSGSYSLKFSRTSAEALELSNVFSFMKDSSLLDRIEVSIWVEAEQLSDGKSRKPVGMTAQLMDGETVLGASTASVNADNDFNGGSEGFEQVVFSFMIKDSTVLEKAVLLLEIGGEASYPTVVYIDDLKVTGYSNEERTKSVKEPAAIGLMRALGIDNIMTRAYIPSRELTRADFADILAGFLKTPPGNGEMKFDDVYQLHYAYQSIKQISDNGIMNGTSATTFEPDESVTYIEALCAMVRFLGYERIANEEGGYSTGYLKVANRLNLTTSVGLEEQVTEEMMSQLLLGFVKAKLLVFTSIKTDTPNYSVKYSMSDGQTILEQNFGVLYNSGILEGNDVTSMNGEVASDNIVIISGNRLVNSKDGDVYNILGRRVDYWYREDSEDADELVFLYDSDSNKVLTITADNYDSMDGSNIQYYADSKKRRVNVYNSTLIYNGKVRNFDSALFDDFFAGTITLVDNNNDSSYDVMLFDKYEYYVVQLTDMVEETITDEYARPKISLKDRTKKMIENEDGTPAEFSDIRSGDLLRIVRPSEEDADFIKVTVLKNQVTGTVQTVSDDTHSGSVKLNDFQYDISPTSKIFINNGYITKLTAGASVTILLDGNKAVTWRTEKSDALITGYIIKGAIKEGFTKTAEFRILTEYGEIEEFTCDEKIRLNSESRVPTTSTNFRNAFFDDSGKIKQQLVRYKINGKGLISELETAEEYVSGQTVLEKDKLVKITDSMNGLFLRRGLTVFHSGGSGDGWSNISSTSVQYSINSGAKFFVIPEVGGRYENDDSFYKVLTANDLIDYRSTYKPMGYTISGLYNQIDYGVIQRDNNGSAVNGFKMTPAIVTDVATAVDVTDPDAEQMLRITCVAGDETTFEATYDNPPDVTDNYYFDWHDIGPGDMIIYSTDAAGMVDLYNYESSFYFLLDYNEKTKELNQVYKNIPSSTNGYMGRIAGEYGAWFNALMRVYMIKDGYVFLNFDERIDSAECNASYPYDKFPTWVFDTERNKLYPGDMTEATQYISDPQNASRVYVSVSGGNPVYMILYK